MKRLKKVSTKELKRAFVIPQLTRATRGNKRYFDDISKQEFATAFVRAKREGLALSEKALDRRIDRDGGRVRRAMHDSYEWYIASATPNELGVWKRAGGLPLLWTKGTLAETARYVKRELKRKKPKLSARAKRAIPGILAVSAKLAAKEKYLFPIAFAGASSRSRKGLKKVAASIDDGNMRAIALAVSGAKRIRIYLGV